MTRLRPFALLLPSLFVLSAPPALAHPGGTPEGGGVVPAQTAPAAPRTDAEYRMLLADLERRVAELKVQVFIHKANLAQLGGTLLHQWPGRRTRIVHRNLMDGGFVPVRIAYAVDGQEVLVRSDARGLIPPGGELVVWEGALPAGNHTLTVMVTYQGHDAVFRYVDGYAITARASHTFVAGERVTRVVVSGRARGNALTTGMTDRPGIEFQAAAVDSPEEKAEKAVEAALPSQPR